MAKRRSISRPRNAATNHRTRMSVSNPDPGGVRRTIKRQKKRWGN